MMLARIYYLATPCYKGGWDGEFLWHLWYWQGITQIPFSLAYSPQSRHGSWLKSAILPKVTPPSQWGAYRQYWKLWES